MIYFEIKVSIFFYMSTVLFCLWAPLICKQRVEEWLRAVFGYKKEKKEDKEKRKHIHTFAMVFPPLQEATSFVVRLQFIRYVSRYSKRHGLNPSLEALGRTVCHLIIQKVFREKWNHHWHWLYHFPLTKVFLLFHLDSLTLVNLS